MMFNINFNSHIILIKTMRSNLIIIIKTNSLN